MPLNARGRTTTRASSEYIAKSHLHPADDTRVNHEKEGDISSTIFKTVFGHPLKESFETLLENYSYPSGLKGRNKVTFPFRGTMGSMLNLRFRLRLRLKQLILTLVGPRDEGGFAGRHLCSFPSR